MKLAEGGCGGDTMIDWEVTACVRVVSVTLREAVKVPDVLYVWDGLWLVLEPPSPKFQLYV